MTLAVLGTYAVSSGFLGDDSRNVVVAARDLPAGSALKSGDLRVVSASVSIDSARNLASSPRQLDNAVLLGPIKSGEFIQAGNIVAKGGIATPEVSFAIPRSRAVGGDLRSGELVDVVVTQKGDDTSPARTAVANASVIKVDKGSSAAIGSGGDVVITVSVSDRIQATALATAVDQGDVTLIRTTGL